MAALPLQRLTAAEYLALERQAETKSEFWNGEIFAMAGASFEHGLLVSAASAALYPQLKGCSIIPNDLRVRVPATDLYTYPDLVIVCEPPRFDEADVDTLVNPTFLVEVLSPSTEDYDRGRKPAHYRTIPSLAGYLLIAQDRVHVELVTRQSDGRWLLTEVEDPNTVLELPVGGAQLAVADLYARMPPGWPAAER